MKRHQTNSKGSTLIFDTLNGDREDNQTTAVSSTFVYDFGVLSMQTEGKNLHYLHDDIGSPIRLIGDHGHENSFSYDEFGNSTHKKGAVRFDQPFTYTGYQLDSLSSSQFAQAREYDPKIGRFTSQDKIAGFAQFPQTINPYTYCWNQPLDLVDLDGEYPDRWRNRWRRMLGLSDDTGISYIFFDPNIQGNGNGHYRAGVLRRELAYYHDYASVSQVRLIPMTNDIVDFTNSWAGMDPENQGIDTVIITGHANPFGIRPYSVYDSEGERDWENMARLYATKPENREYVTSVSDLDIRNIDILLLLGCRTAQPRENERLNIAEAFAYYGHAQTVIGAGELVRVRNRGREIINTGLSSDEDSPYYRVPGPGFIVLNSNGEKVGLIGRSFSWGIGEMLDAVNNLLSGGCVDCD